MDWLPLTAIKPLETSLSSSCQTARNEVVPIRPGQLGPTRLALIEHSGYVGADLGPADVGVPTLYGRQLVNSAAQS